MVLFWATDKSIKSCFGKQINSVGAIEWWQTKYSDESKISVVAFLHIIKFKMKSVLPLSCTTDAMMLHCDAVNNFSRSKHFYS